MDKEEKYLSLLFCIFSTAFTGLVVATFIYLGIDLYNQPEIEVSRAKPIYQQLIGDEADPDILIIYEAEVDGVKVYPSVIKEANNGE